MSGNDYGFNAKSTSVIYIFAYYVVNRDVVAYICRRKNVLFDRKNWIYRNTITRLLLHLIVILIENCYI